MQLRLDQLANKLKRDLLPVYFVYGEEYLLVDEANQQIRTSAKNAGFNEREIYHAEGSFHWEKLLEAANSLSLFAEKKLIEIRIPSGKPSDKGEALIAYCKKPPEDAVLLIISGKLESSVKRAKWYNEIDKLGVVVPIWPIDESQLPTWIFNRLKQNNIQASQEAIQILAERVEGNLLAAAQEIEKLKLFYTGIPLDAETVINAVSDNARFDVFNLVDKVMRGKTTDALRALNGLRNESNEPTIVLWAIVRELRNLYEIKLLLDSGINLEIALNKMGIWEKRKVIVKTALTRLKVSDIEEMLQNVSQIDQATKGINTINPWDQLASLICSFTGHKLPI